MSANVPNYTSGFSGHWGKTNLVSPFVSYYSIGVFKVVTGSLNPFSGMLMATVASIVDIASACITGGSKKEEDMFFRLATTVVVPFTLAIAFGLPFPAAVTISVINLGIRVLLSDYLFHGRHNYQDS